MPARIAALAMALIGAAAAADPSAPEAVVRDAWDGRGLSARVELAPARAPVPPTARALTAVLDDAERNGRLRSLEGMRHRLALEGPVVARISHPGYRPLLTVLEPGGAGMTGWTLWLSPEHRDQPTVAAGTVHGHVIDPASLQPLAGAQVVLAGRSQHTDERGHFSLQAPIQSGRGEPHREQLRVVAGDGRRLERAIAIADGADLRLIVDFDAADDEDPGHRHLRRGRDGIQHWPDHLDAGQRLDLRDDALLADEPPASIRVGFGNAGCSATCCTGGCSHVCVFDLETYVRRGLNDEWIASWNTHALRAGSVAYRSYGAWHAFNPVPGRPFDLCSSACCQVNDPDTSAGTDLATGRTAGVMLIRNDQVFRSEYSAENNCLLGTMSCANNDLSCGNGYAGSPATGWPCLADPVGLDRDCFGHGRGMSQWGTQRWSLAPHGHSWRWQLNHYYNDHGAGDGLRTATISRVLALEDIRPRQRTLRAGDTLAIDYDARNLAAETHQHVLLGASLRQPPGPFVDDPGNDWKVALPAGASRQQRAFDLPAALPSGRYDLYASLYLDIDENDAISSADLAQDLLSRPQAVRVVAAGDLIFYDGMQPL